MRYTLLAITLHTRSGSGSQPIPLILWGRLKREAIGNQFGKWISYEIIAVNPLSLISITASFSSPPLATIHLKI